jgi:predicted small lipoprotein YifL
MKRLPFTALLLVLALLPIVLAACGKGGGGY